MRGPCGLDSWSSGEGTRTLAGLPARGPLRTRKDSSQAGGEGCPERMGEGVWKVKAIPGGPREWVEQRVTDVIQVGRARSREDTQHQLTVRVSAGGW